MRIKGRVISKGNGGASGEAVVSREPITFLGGVDPETGMVTEKGHGLFGRSINGKVLIFPKGKGSTVGSFVLYQMKRNGTAPAGIIAVKADEMVATGAVIAGIPMIDSLEGDPLKIRDGTPVKINAEEGYVEVQD